MAFSDKKDLLTAEFVQHLKSLGVASNTLKNYRSDLAFFSSWVASQLKTKDVLVESLSEALPFFSPSLIKKFKTSLPPNVHSRRTVNRRLSSLRALSRFLIQTQILESDFMEGVMNLGSFEDSSQKYPLVGHFQKHLEAQDVSKNTIRNYVSDVKHFMSWLESQGLVSGS